LSVSVAIDPCDDYYFYALAEAILENLTTNGKSDLESRLLLAVKLGMLDDRRWFGETGLHFSGNTPRHRAIARFAVEKCLRAIVSLNWDTLLEAALESVGLTEGSNTPRPWEITSYVRIVDDFHLGALGSNRVFPVIKPHGCVREIEKANRTYQTTGIIQDFIFKLKKSELEILPPGQTKLYDNKVAQCISECPLIAIGWKATEDYLRNTIITVAKATGHTEVDSFVLVSRSWYPNTDPSKSYHLEIADAYNKDEAACFVAVNKTGAPTHDCLFQWLQARYALTKLIAVGGPSEQHLLQHCLESLEHPEPDNAIVTWVDFWLHTWVRLCWRAGVMQGFDPGTNKKIEPWDIPITPRDAHVPLGWISTHRRDLQAAGKFLTVINSTLSRFKFDTFPGGLWDAAEQNLYLPLPGWQGAATSTDLIALKSLVESLRGLGYVRKIYLVWLDTTDLPPDHAHRQQLEAQVRRMMPLTGFASTDAISWIDLELLKGGTHAAVAGTV